MNDSFVTSQGEPDGPRWLLLIHQLPPKPDYFRVKVRRRLQRLAAVPLKSTVYVLPNRRDTLEDFHWLLEEILAEGGEATLCAGAMLGGATDAEIEALFRVDRDDAYAEIARSARDLARANEPPADVGAEVARLRRRLEEVRKADFFDAPRRTEAERAIAELEQAGSPPEAPAAPGATARPAVPRASTWVTREGVFVDRIASAWLIRRFIDPDAAFKFVPGQRYRARPGELRFDMYPAEYTHEGDCCTFETLLARFGLDDPALSAIAEIVHDIDLKDEKYGREEAGGVAAVLGGIARAYPDDAERLRLGGAVFESLYTQLGAAAGS